MSTLLRISRDVVDMRYETGVVVNVESISEIIRCYEYTFVMLYGCDIPESAKAREWVLSRIDDAVTFRPGGRKK